MLQTVSEMGHSKVFAVEVLLGIYQNFKQMKKKVRGRQFCLVR